VAHSDELTPLLRVSWSTVLENIGDAVIIMDENRQLRYANGRARRVLGFREGELVAGRCRHTTRGVDCDAACPLTVALNMGREIVRDFETTYTSRDGRAVPLSVTIIPLLDDDGGFIGAIEILRPVQSDRGFFLVGRSAEATRARRALATLSESGCDVILVGEPPACLDVAKCLHRAGGLDEGLFQVWSGDGECELGWPPGTACCFGHEDMAALSTTEAAGWRRVYCLQAVDHNGTEYPQGVEVLRLPEPCRMVEDLPEMMVAWVRRSDPGLEISADALQYLVTTACERGLTRVAEILPQALAVADGRLELEHFPGPQPDDELIDDLLREKSPMAAMERRVLGKVLERSGWRMQDAAERLGMSRVTLWRKLKEHGIERP